MELMFIVMAGVFVSVVAFAIYIYIDGFFRKKLKVLTEKECPKCLERYYQSIDKIFDRYRTQGPQSVNKNLSILQKDLNNLAKDYTKKEIKIIPERF